MASGSLTVFRVAVNPKPEVTEWYRITVWGELGEHVAKNIKKGDAVKVQGHLRSKVIAGDESANPPVVRREFFEVVGKKIGVFIAEDEIRWLKLAVKGGVEQRTEEKDDLPF